MPNPDHYNMNYRPGSYWGPKELPDHFSTRIKGELRRRAVVSELENGHDVVESVVCDSLSADELKAVSAVHPWLMGGEYLPDFKGNEVEIARVTLKSTTLDVISIRARRTRKRIHYRIVDEYGEPDFFNVVNPYRKKALTFREIIRLINNATESGGLVDGFRNGNYEGGAAAEEIYDFASVFSVFYEELEQWYDEVNAEWLRERKKELEDDDDRWEEVDCDAPFLETT
jgi:hypothetical protein